MLVEASFRSSSYSDDSFFKASWSLLEALLLLALEICLILLTTMEPTCLDLVCNSSLSSSFVDLAGGQPCEPGCSLF
jgi:hypothetical protein